MTSSIRKALKPVGIILFLGLAWLIPNTAMAEGRDAGTSQVYSLTDRQKDDLISANAAKAGSDSLSGTGACPVVGQVHGEAGAMIGSDGTRGAYGAAAVPLGCHANVAVAVSNTHFGGYRRR